MIKDKKRVQKSNEQAKLRDRRVINFKTILLLCLTQKKKFVTVLKRVIAAKNITQNDDNVIDENEIEF